MKKHLIILVMALAAIATSCSTTQDTTSITTFGSLSETSGTLPANTFEQLSVIAPDDELLITVNSANPEATAMFTAPLSNTAYRGNANTQGQPTMLTYVVDDEGCISFPVLGKLKMAGLTVKQATELVTQRVGEMVKDPYVRVQNVSKNIVVLGEVGNPRRIWPARERYTIIDAIADCNDITQYGQRDRVLVIRKQPDGSSAYQRIDLNSKELFSSPYYYMQPGDIVYVEPNAVKTDNSKYNQYHAFKLSQASIWVSVASIITSLVIALAVK